MLRINARHVRAFVPAGIICARHTRRTAAGPRGATGAVLSLPAPPREIRALRTFRPSAAPRRSDRAGPSLGRTDSPAPGRARRPRRSDLRPGRGRPRAAAGGSVASFRRRRPLAALRRRARTGARDGQLRRRSNAGRGPGRASACSRRSRAVVPRQGRAPPDATPRRRRAEAQVPGGRRRAARARGAGPGRAVRSEPSGPGALRGGAGPRLQGRGGRRGSGPARPCPPRSGPESLGGGAR